MLNECVFPASLWLWFDCIAIGVGGHVLSPVCGETICFSRRHSRSELGSLLHHQLPSSHTHTDTDTLSSRPHLLRSASFVNGDWFHYHKWRRWLPGSRKRKKRMHLWLQGVALASGVFGIWTKFQGTEGVVANFYSLHSWMGLLCVSLFGAQEKNHTYLLYKI
ncbi:hypothetical protein L1987_73013 [Smallanthus sonchifolius]|uniref:Uncharacterized protein n=1 Tax=Smallanthus sonchifolius TaxID=185202 RepID=A0ACB9AWU7_9ASTR|nr:hypothetical protein L1987_73013 [Smallanthus sonchifolius]